MRRLLRRWLGVGLLSLLVAGLVAMLPARTALVLSKLPIPRPPALTWTEVPVPTPKAKQSPAAPPDSGAAERPQAVVLPAPEATPAENEPEPETYTLQFGPFVTATEADDIEARLNELGASTIRIPERSSIALYAVRVGEFATLTQAIETTKHLTLRHPALRLGKLETTAGGALTIVADSFHPLREAVALAQELRKEGFAVQVKAAGGAASVFVVRVKTIYDLKTAQEMSRQFHTQGLPNAVSVVEPSSSH